MADDPKKILNDAAKILEEETKRQRPKPKKEERDTVDDRDKSKAVAAGMAVIAIGAVIFGLTRQPNAQVTAQPVEKTKEAFFTPPPEPPKPQQIEVVVKVESPKVSVKQEAKVCKKPKKPPINPYQPF